jgi:aspartyl protease/PDZ domain-containing protein
MWCAVSVAQTDGHCSVTLAQAFQVSGGDTWRSYGQMRIDGSKEQNGLRTPFSSVTDLRSGRWREQYRHGSFALAEGYDGHVLWSEWKPGDVVESNDPGKQLFAQTAHYERMRAYWLTERMKGKTACVHDVEQDGKRYSVYRLLPQGGRPFELWLDVATRMIARRVDHNGPFEHTTVYDDYRETSGLHLPYRVDDRDYFGNLQRLEVSRITLAADIEESAIAKARAQLTDYSLPNGRDRVTVPLRLLNNHLYIPVKFNGRGPYWMMIDSGAHCVVTSQLAATLQLPDEGSELRVGNGANAARLGHAKLDTIDIGGAVLREQRCDVIDLRAFAYFEGVDQFGLVGYEVYRRFVVRHDHAGDTLSLIDPAHFSPASDDRQVPFEFFDTTPVAAGSIDGIAGRFLVDTGSRSAVSPHNWLVEREHLLERHPNGLPAVIGFGVGGQVRGYVVRSKQVLLGDVPFGAALLQVQNSGTDAQALEDTAADVGVGLLSRYEVVTFDYSRRRILFRGPLQNPPNDLDRSGLQMKRTPGGFEVIDVSLAGPAAAAGVRVGDVIVEVDGRSATQWTLPALRDRLRVSPIGTHVRGTAMRASERRTFELTLRDLLPQARS